MRAGNSYLRNAGDKLSSRECQVGGNRVLAKASRRNKIEVSLEHAHRVSLVSLALAAGITIHDSSRVFQMTAGVVLNGLLFKIGHYANFIGPKQGIVRVGSVKAMYVVLQHDGVMESLFEMDTFPTAAVTLDRRKSFYNAELVCVKKSFFVNVKSLRTALHMVPHQEKARWVCFIFVKSIWIHAFGRS